MTTAGILIEDDGFSGSTYAEVPEPMPRFMRQLLQSHCQCTQQGIPVSPIPVHREFNAQRSTPRRKRLEFRQVTASEQALTLAERANVRMKKRATTVRYRFVELPRDAGPGAVPPMARLMAGSKGAAVRIRLYLALLWMAGGGDDRHTVEFPARAFAELLDLPDPERRGDQRVRNALRLFERERLLLAEKRPGRPSLLALLHESGSGDTYSRPGGHAVAAKERNEVDVDNLFIRLPPGFWTNGWAVTLGAPGLAMLLVLLVVTSNASKQRQWVAPSERPRYGLSDDTWTRGLAELARLGVITVGKRPVGDLFDQRRVRNTYSVNIARLDEAPASES